MKELFTAKELPSTIVVVEGVLKRHSRWDGYDLVCACGVFCKDGVAWRRHVAVQVTTALAKVAGSGAGEVAEVREAPFF